MVFVLWISFIIQVNKFLHFYGKLFLIDLRHFRYNFQHQRKIRKFSCTNCIYSPAIRANVQKHSERLRTFARIVRANISVRVSVNAQAKIKARTFARIVRANNSRQCETALRIGSAFVELELRLGL